MIRKDQGYVYYPETEAIENKLKELDEIVIRHGIDINDLFVNSNEIEQDDIADQVINFLKKLLLHFSLLLMHFSPAWKPVPERCQAFEPLPSVFFLHRIDIG